ncbi:cytochrome P450 [Streptomyces sp. AJS327]|uniref:cytochrome P450 n=1 Tax=Streptomyces sp. AJS327 TaxID=2545265 RepID=UPI0015DE764D|nr:cytochrome P450 [Streptomyces sp. AJS327]MBA0052761.1 cytochrome P450 [Streptomyces sp. AJS327]
MPPSLKHLPRAPGHLPVLGHTAALWRKPHAFLKGLPEAGPLVRIHLGTMPICFATSSELTYEVLATKGRYFEKGRLFDRMQPLVGRGLATATGDVHRQHRRMIQPVFHHERIADYTRIMARQAEALADSWEPGQRLAVEEVMGSHTIETLAACMFSTDIGKPAVEVIGRDVPTVLKMMLIRAVSPKILDRVPLGPNRKFDLAAARLRKVLDEVVTATREADRDPEDHPDLLSMLLAARDMDSGDGLTDREVRDELMTMLVAGTDTAAATLAWTMHEVGRHPEVEQRLLEEVDTVLGGRPVTHDDLPKLVYLRQVIDEVVRLHGVTLLMRRALEPVDLGGYTIPEGTEVGISLYALHYDPEHYPDPHRFDPERQVPERMRELPRGAYMPFGAGSRKCIGDSFSWAEILVTLATLFQRWRLRPVPGHTVKEVIAGMAGPDHVPMTVTAR